MWTVGIDFGGTNIKVGLVADRGVIRAQDALATAEHATPSRFVDGVAQTIARLAERQRLSRRELRGVGLGAPGLLDARRGVIHRLVNVPGGWRGVPLARLMRQRLRCRCVIDNDANVVALGEWRFGAGRGTRHGVYVTLGTGVGGGVILNGALVRGAAGSAGELGHVTIDPDGPRCGCGNRGCLEAFVGTAALLRQARGAATPQDISRAASAGDPAARRIWRDVGVHLGTALAGVVNVLGPERIVIGGGVAGAWRWFAPSLRRTLRGRAFEVPARACRVVRAACGDSAGILGAAMLVWEAT